MKWRWIVLAIAVVSAIVVNGQEKRSKPGPDQDHPQNVGTPPAPAPQVVCVVNQPNSKPEGNRAESHPQGYLSRLISPENPNISAIGLILVGIGGIWVAVRTLNHMRDSSERQLRAYVYVDSAMVKFDRPGAPEAQVHFKNFGQTPAFDVQAWIHMYIGPYPLNTVLQPAPPGTPMGKEPMAPGRASAHAIRLSPPVEPSTPFGTRAAAVYVHGEITYKDAFGLKRETKYRLICGLDAPRPVPKRKDDVDVFTHYFMQADTEGNEAT
jgi:hypothetical protein